MSLKPKLGMPFFYCFRMQIVWHGEFKKNFQQFGGEQWILTPTDDAPDHPEKWCLFKDSAKVRFMCHVSTVSYFTGTTFCATYR